jgi:hypothetical protein
VGNGFACLVVVGWTRVVVGGEFVVIGFDWGSAAICWGWGAGCAGWYEVGAVVVRVDVGNKRGVVLMGRALRWCCVSLYADSGCRGGCRGRDVVVVRSWSGDALGPDLSEVVCGN